MSKRKNESRHSVLDRVFFKIVTAGWANDRVSTYASQVGRLESGLPKSMSNGFQLIDVKATGLLTHVSLMIAGLGLVAPLVADNHIELGVVIAEIAVYLLISVGCIRCLAIFNWRELETGGPGAVRTARREMVIRRELYALCNGAATVFTIFVFLLLPLIYFYRPSSHP